MKSLVSFLILGTTLIFAQASIDLRQRRSIDLSASHALIPDARLPKDVIPTNYIINIRPNMEEGSFTGNIKMNLSWNDDTRKISLHAHFELNIEDVKIRKIDTKKQ